MMKKLGDDDYIVHLSIDCVIFGYQDKELKVLISKFKFGAGTCSLPGGYLLPDTFTMREVQELYEAVYNKPFVITNFQKRLLDLNVLERLEKKFTGAANKAPYLYRFKK